MCGVIWWSICGIADAKSSFRAESLSTCCAKYFYKFIDIQDQANVNDLKMRIESWNEIFKYFLLTIHESESFVAAILQISLSTR
jgi:hypothetical protein